LPGRRVQRFAVRGLLRRYSCFEEALSKLGRCRRCRSCSSDFLSVFCSVFFSPISLCQPVSHGKNKTNGAIENESILRDRSEAQKRRVFGPGS
jgi:hypothetical protein